MQLLKCRSNLMLETLSLVPGHQCTDPLRRQSKLLAFACARHAPTSARPSMAPSQMASATTGLGHAGSIPLTIRSTGSGDGSQRHVLPACTRHNRGRPAASSDNYALAARDSAVGQPVRVCIGTDAVLSWWLQTDADECRAPRCRRDLERDCRVHRLACWYPADGQSRAQRMPCSRSGPKAKGLQNSSADLCCSVAVSRTRTP